MNIRRSGAAAAAPHAAAAAPAAPAPGASPAACGHDRPGSRRDPHPPTKRSRTAPHPARRPPKAPRAAAAHWAALLACALLAALAAPPLWANAGLLADIDGAIEFHETRTKSQAHIAFWKQVRAAVVAEAVPDALKQEFDQRAAGAKPGGRFHQLYMDVKAAFDRILNPPAPTATISVSPQAIELGQPATLSWSATNSDTTTLDGVEVERSGSREVSPHVTTTYALQASNGGGTAYVTAELEVTPPRAQQSDQNTQQPAGWADASDIVIEEGGYFPQEDFAIVLGAGDSSVGVVGSPWPGYAGAAYPERYVGTKTYDAGDHVVYLRSGVNRIFRRQTSGSDGNAKGPLFSTNRGNWEETTPYDGNGVAHGFGIVPMDWPAPGYITIRSFGFSGTQDDNYPEFCSAIDDSDCGAGAPAWRARPESFNTDGTGNAKMSIEVNTVDDNIVQADRVHSLELKRFGNKLGAKRIVVKEDDLWMATVRRRGGHAGGRCLAWAACQQGPSPEEDRYTVRGGIEFGQPGYDPNAAVTGCLHDLWDRTSACTRTQGGSPKRLVIGTGGPLAFAKGLDGPDGGDHYDLGEGEGGYYYINKQRRVDGGATSLAPFQVLSLYAYCDGPACGEAPFVLAAPLPDPYETITIAANVLTDRDSFSRSLVGDCNSGEANLRFEVIPARRVLSASVNIGGTFRTLKLPPSGAEIPFPEADRIKFLPASIDWCE